MALSSCASSPTVDDHLRRAAEFLWDAQADDGGWHSETHGLLRGGQAWTPFVLHTLLDVPPEVFPLPSDRVERALQFIRRHVNEDGAVGLADPDVLEYPNYATSYAMRVLVEAGEPADSVLILKMTDYLVGQQFVEHRGIDVEHAIYGAWGFGEVNLPHGAFGHIDLSHTRRVLQALDLVLPPDHPAFEKAKRFLGTLQNYRHVADAVAGGEPTRLDDGGFFASTTSLGTNKGGFVETAPGLPNAIRSYATTTCDGVLALLAAGVGLDDGPTEAAANWLSLHKRLARQQGLSPDDPYRWAEVMFFYHLAVRSEAYVALDIHDGWRAEMTALLAARQQSDGRFENPMGAANKENDPILASALAIIGLTGISERGGS